MHFYFLHAGVTATSEANVPKQLRYKLIGDNIDKGVKARFMRVEDHSNKSLHYFHACAIEN